MTQSDDRWPTDRPWRIKKHYIWSYLYCLSSNQRWWSKPRDMAQNTQTWLSCAKSWRHRCRKNAYTSWRGNMSPQSYYVSRVPQSSLHVGDGSRKIDYTWIYRGRSVAWMGEPAARKQKVMIDSDTLVTNLTAICGRHLTARMVGWVLWSSGKHRQSFFRNLRKSHVAFTSFLRRRIKAKELSAQRAMWWQSWEPHWTLNISMSYCWSVHRTNIELA